MLNPAKDIAKEFAVSDLHKKIVKDILVKIEKAEKLSEALMTVYEKFMA